MMKGCMCDNIVTYLDAFVKPHEGLSKLWVRLSLVWLCLLLLYLL